MSQLNNIAYVHVFTCLIKYMQHSRLKLKFFAL